MSEFGLNTIFQSVKSAFLPALIFATTAFYGTAFPIRDFENNIFFHVFFLSMSVLGIGFLSQLRQIRALLFLACLIGAYLFINSMKARFGAAFFESPPYFLLLTLIPLNFLLITLVPRRGFNERNNFYALGLLLGQGVLLENMPLTLSWTHFWAVGLLLWFLLFVYLLIRVCLNGRLDEESLLFMAIAVFLSFINAKSPEDLCLYAAAAVLILIVSTMLTLFYAYFKDEETGVYSRNTFYRHASSRFPLKYSLAVVCIDDYAKLQKVLKPHDLRALIRLVLEIIYHAPVKSEVYRFCSDEFVLIFKKEDKKQTYQYLENIRREVAGTTFVLNHKQQIKITISAGVSEKKRSDADAEAVLVRTRDVLQKAYKFTQNLTSEA